MPGFLRAAAYGAYARKYGVNLGEAEHSLDAYRSFDAFFTRRLRAGLRPLDLGPGAIVSPVDGTVSASGAIRENTLLQAKGIDYTLEALFANDARAQKFRDGNFLTIYLAPGDCHRIHAPLDATLTDLQRIGGTLFPVRASAVERIPGLFTRNERVVFYLDTDFGPAVLIMVGALNVGSIESLHQPGTRVRKGEDLAIFHLGSTVILLFPNGKAKLQTLNPGSKLRIGEKIATA